MLPLSLSKARALLRRAFCLFDKRGSELSPQEREECYLLLNALRAKVEAKERRGLRKTATALQSFLNLHFPKPRWRQALEFVGGLAFALVVALLIREMWFELYEVPTGSMRPTIEEKDRLVVSKTSFGLHLPFTQGLLLYSPKALKRSDIIVFTVEGMEGVTDPDTLYFHILPGKKRYVKRCLGLPGDTLYFYGGRLYGIDKEGKPILELADEERLHQLGLEQIDYVPYITFEGRMELGDPLSYGRYGKSEIRQMNLPLAKLSLKRDQTIEGLFYNGTEWVPDQLEGLKKPHSSPLSYSDLWGMGNYAMARLLTKEEAKSFYSISPEDNALLYLELKHTPNLSYPKPTMRQGASGALSPQLNALTALIPLEESHLNRLRHALYTARFYVEEEHAYRYTEQHSRPQPPEWDPLLPHVPNGCYEFYAGKGYRIDRWGIRHALPEAHPLYAQDPELLRKLFNLGFSFNLLTQPKSAVQPFVPQRFATFRNGDLYVMGAPLLKKGEPTLENFLTNELKKEQSSASNAPYIAFVDHGPPLLKGGEWDVEFIRHFGLKIPEDRLLALGDNFALSADSRDFGFVPTQNLRGSPAFTFWPPSSRLGALPQPPGRWLALPNLLIWSLVFLIFLGWRLYTRQRDKKICFKNRK